MNEFNVNEGIKWANDALELFNHYGELMRKIGEGLSDEEKYMNPQYTSTMFERQEIVDAMCKVHSLVNPVVCREVKKIIERAEGAGKENGRVS